MSYEWLSPSEHQCDEQFTACSVSVTYSYETTDITDPSEENPFLQTTAGNAPVVVDTRRSNRGMGVQDPAEKRTPHQKDFLPTTNPSAIVQPNGFVNNLNPLEVSISHQGHFMAKHFLCSILSHKNGSRSPVTVLTDKTRLLATAILLTRKRFPIHLIAQTIGIENGFLVEALVCASANSRHAFQRTRPITVRTSRE